MPRGRRQFVLPKCYCGRLATVKTSWTDKNPSRRFASCAHYQGESCDFFKWLDPEMCERSAEVIPGLLRRIRSIELDIKLGADKMKKCEDKVEELKLKNRKLCAENRRLKLKIRFLLFVIGILCVMYISSLYSTVVMNGGDEVMKHKAIGNL